ncbi:MAG: FKBP-type peptidyl-prolyl cis-trans isomerase [Candidatus Diapherotrites archaeon]|nr:FKBP-type peptidyl-prolyl cis-trans isomerase [Candidatus Diapherotrites archaeon]
MLLIHLIGRETESGRLFETTEPEVAKDSGAGESSGHFTPLSVVLGRGQVLPALEKVLESLPAGEKKTLVLAPADAFGERRKDLVRVIPLAQFHEQTLRPFPGLVINADGMSGRVQSVSGGRVRVDFNSDLAGKPVEYTVWVEKEITSADEKLSALVKKFFHFEQVPSFKRENAKLTVSLPGNLPREIELVQKIFEREVREVVPEVTEVAFESVKAPSPAP